MDWHSNWTKEHVALSNVRMFRLFVLDCGHFSDYGGCVDSRESQMMAIAVDCELCYFLIKTYLS